MTIRHVIFDVDDVLVDTDLAVAAAERAIVEPLSQHLPRDIAERVGLALTAGYERLIRALRSGRQDRDLDAWVGRIHAHQRAVTDAGYEPKLWSRESLVAIALEDVGVSLDGAIVSEAVRHYWRVVADRTVINADARRAVAIFKDRGISVHLATNSDGTLLYSDDVRAFVYDPAHALARKLERLACLGELGLEARDVSIGDPIGKPKRAFFEKVLTELGAKLGEAIAPDEVLAVGDSLTHDVLPLIALGARRGAWLVRAEVGRAPRPVEGEPGVMSIGSLDLLPRLAGVEA